MADLLKTQASPDIESTAEAENPHVDVPCDSIRKNKELISQEFQRVLLANNRIAKSPVVSIVEKHIFSFPSPAQLITVTSSCNSSTRRDKPEIKKNKTPLSKMIEYPGDPALVTSLLKTDANPQIDPAGKDMLGYSALHKFASWDKIDLLEMLLPHLTSDDICQPAGWSHQSSYLGQTVLHLCVDACAWRTLRYLLDYCDENGIVLGDVCDVNGKTYRDMAIDLGREDGVILK